MTPSYRAMVKRQTSSPKSKISLNLLRAWPSRLHVSCLVLYQLRQYLLQLQMHIVSYKKEVHSHIQWVCICHMIGQQLKYLFTVLRNYVIGGSSILFLFFKTVTKNGIFAHYTCACSFDHTQTILKIASTILKERSLEHPLASVATRRCWCWCWCWCDPLTQLEIRSCWIPTGVYKSLPL